MRHRLFSQFVSVSAMAGVGMILVATTVPANAFIKPESAATAESQSYSGSQSGDAQELSVAASAQSTVTRDAYTVVSAQQKVQVRTTGGAYFYTNNPAGVIQWPFPSGVTITSGFGSRRVSGCGYCSTYHEGLDFTPGAGTPIQSIAAGVVRKVDVSGSAYGNYVIVDHVVNGQNVQSLYAHMQYGSIKVAEGQAVTVAQPLGAVGNTGISTGAHLHLEVHLDGVPVDPFAWLQANAN